MRWLLLTGILLCGCTEETKDAGSVDAGSDAGSDAGPDAGSDAADAGLTDTGLRDADLTDLGPADGHQDAGSLDAESLDAESLDACSGTIDRRGFCIRRPIERTVQCSTGNADAGSYPAEMTAEDIDHLCTLVYNEVNGHVYVRADLDWCDLPPLGWQTFNYRVTGAWVEVDGGIAPVVATYNYGGNHRNDFIELDYASYRFKLYHSSFGYGFRKCQPPDCLTVYDSNTGNMIEEGCLSSRTLPIVCVRVAPDGGVPDELIDNFSKCPGDPNIDAG